MLYSQTTFAIAIYCVIHALIAERTLSNKYQGD